MTIEDGIWVGRSVVIRIEHFHERISRKAFYTPVARSLLIAIILLTTLFCELGLESSSVQIIGEFLDYVVGGADPGRGQQ